MKITWVTRSFLDYRIPVFKALDKMCGHELRVIYYKDIPPVNCREKLEQILGDRATARENELRFGNKPKIDNMSLSNTSFRIPVSPGLVKQVIETKPDVLVSDGFMQWTYAPLVVRALKGIPHVMCYERTAHTERNANGLRKNYRKFVSRWIDAIDCNGSLTGEYVKSLLGWDDSRLTFGHMVADVEGLRNQVKAISDENSQKLRGQLGVCGTMLLYVGQLISRKGVRELLSAYAHIAERIPNMTLVMVGGGPLEEELKKRIMEEKIPNVVVTGRVDYDDVATYYRAADCFILPTTEDNWSLVVPEAMACGLPIATTIYNGCHPELVHPDNGWVFDSLNPRSIEETLLNIYSHREKLPEMGKVSERIVASETAERAAQSIMDAIQIAMNRKKK